MMSHRNPESLFYFFKQLDNSTALACIVTASSIPESNLFTYDFTLSIKYANGYKSETVTDATCSRSEAEHLFNLLCTGNVRPCHLKEVISDTIGRSSYDSSADYNIV